MGKASYSRWTGPLSITDRARSANTSALRELLCVVTRTQVVRRKWRGGMTIDTTPKLQEIAQKQHNFPLPSPQQKVYSEGQRVRCRGCAEKEFPINAAIQEEPEVSEDSRIVRLGSDLQHVQADLTDVKADMTKVKADLTELKADVTEVKTDIRNMKTEIRDIKTEIRDMKTDIKDLRIDLANSKADFADFKVDMAEQLGAVRTSIESVRTALERTKLWMVVTGAGAILSVWGAALGLARYLKP
jgi:hypothetical protein